MFEMIKKLFDSLIALWRSITDDDKEKIISVVIVLFKAFFTQKYRSNHAEAV